MVEYTYKQRRNAGRLGSSWEENARRFRGDAFSSRRAGRPRSHPNAKPQFFHLMHMMSLSVHHLSLPSPPSLSPMPIN